MSEAKLPEREITNLPELLRAAFDVYGEKIRARALADAKAAIADQQSEDASFQQGIAYAIAAIERLETP